MMSRTIKHFRRGSRFPGYCFLLFCLACLVEGTSCTKKMITDPLADSLYLGTVPFVIDNNATFSNYYASLGTTGWLDTLYGPGPFTVLLTNNDAYSGYPASYTNTAGNLADYENAEVGGGLTIYNVVGYSVVRGLVSFRKLPLGANQELTSLTGRTMYVTRYLSPGGDTLTTVDGQAVISLDNPATNGLIQVVSGAVPYPDVYPTVLEQIQSDTNLAYFAAALQRTHLDTLLKGTGPYTVLAPTNQFASLDSVLTGDPIALANFVKYHIMRGRYFLSDFSRQLTTDTLLLTMLNGGIVKYNLSPYYYGVLPFMSDAPGAGTLQPTFTGNGDPSAGPVSSTVYDEDFFTIESYVKNGGDLTAQNGVVHTMYGVLNP